MNDSHLLSIIGQANAEKWSHLDLSYKGLTHIPKEINRLTRLTSLNLAGNKLEKLPESIGQLVNLAALNLSGNQLRAIPDEISGLKNLTFLDLQKNRLTDLPLSLFHLIQLERLILRYNNLLALPKEIGALTNLRELNLMHNQISTLPVEIGLLSNLIYLRLNKNRLSSLPDEFAGLEKLQQLSCSNNQLHTFPEAICELRTLTRLTLSSNLLAVIPPEIGNLTNLTYLRLSNNHLQSLPRELGLLENLKTLEVMRNPLNFPAAEIVAQGTSAILSFFRTQLIASKRQWLSKLLIVGEGGVGKTSVLFSLLQLTFNSEHPSTHGIEVTELNLTHPTEPDVNMQLKAWDFGGQEIYHATHQFFLTNRSLFMLVWNARHGWEQGQIHRWLDVIHSRAPESPIIIVATHTDERDAVLPGQELQKTYPQIAGFCAVSNKTKSGIPGLRDKLAEVAISLPLMGESWPKTWLEAATDIREYPDKHITPQRLFSLMADHSVTGENADILARWLHELGDILYYEEDEQLNDLVILKPQWVTRHISDVLGSEDVIGSLGIFTREHMNLLWSELPASLRDHFLRLMEQFDLSYRIPEHRDISLVVERLSLDPPAYQPTWEAIRQRPPCQEMAMTFRLNTIPPGVPIWFIARQHRFTTYTHWRSGVLFAQDNRDSHQAQHLALVTANAHDRTVTLTVRGPYPHNFFALLKDGLELTLARFPGLKIERLMPCPTPGCVHQFNYEDLQRRLSKKPEIECPKCWQDISVPQLLFGIDWRTQDAVIERLNTLVGGQQEILKETRQLKELTDREFLALFRRDQRLAESHCPNVFLLYPVQREWYKKPFTKQKMGLHLCCQAPNEWHYAYHGYERVGYYEFEVAADWLVKMAPYLKMLFRLVQLATPFFHTSFGVSRADMEQEWSHHVDLMNSLLTHLPAMDGAGFDDMEGLDRLAEDSWHGLRFEATGAALRQIRALLDEQDPGREWGGLRKVLTPEGHYLWLCEYHAAQYRG